MTCRHCHLPIVPFQGKHRHDAPGNQSVWCELEPIMGGHLTAEPPRSAP